MSGKSAAIVRPSFETGHLLTFRTSRSAVSQSASLVGSSVLAGASPPGLNSMRSSAAPSPARVARSDSVVLTTPRCDLAAGALMQKLLNDEHAVAAQNMSEMAGRRDISIMKLSDMCSLLRADLQSLEQENAQLSAKLRASETESQELRLRIGTMSQREALYQESVSQHANLQKEFSELRSREQVVALSLTQAERQRDAALQQLGQCKLKTAAATDSAAHASTLMQAMECDLVSAQRARASVQDSLAACAAERDALQLRLSQLQRELEVSAHSDAQNRIQVDLLKESVVCSQELQARSDSIVLQLRQELQRKQQSTEHVSIEFQSEQMRAKALEEDSKALQLAHKDETDALQGRIHSDQVLLKQQQNEIFDLISARDAAQHKCDELQSNAVSLESSRADVYNALQAQISANAQYTAEIRELRHALDTLPSKQRDHFENELRRCRQASTGLQSQLDLVEQQSAEFSAFCSSQQQSIHALTQKLEANTTERLALEMQLDSLRSRVQKHEAAYASLSQESQAQLSHLSDDAKQAHAKTNELRFALSDMTSRFNEISGALARAVVDLEVKDSELKSTAKQARTKSHQQEDSLSRLQDQYLKLQHESIETSSRLQQQLLAAEQSAASRASRIIALEEAISVLREATAEARISIPLLHSKLSSLSEENSSLRSHMLSMSSESISQEELSEEKDHVLQIQNQVQEKSMQLAVLQQAHELQLKSAQDTIDQQNAELQRIRDSSVRSTETFVSASHLPVFAARLSGALGSLKGQVISLRNSYNDEIQALWVCMGKSMEAILSIANAESARSRIQIIQLQHDITTLCSRNSELESAMSKDAAVYEAAEAALIFERVRWETRTLELRDSLDKAENGVSSLNLSVSGLKESLKSVNTALLAQQLRMAGVLSTLCPLFLPNDHVLSMLTDGLCPNIFVLRMCCRICSEHNPEFSAALLSNFDFAPSHSSSASANQASEFHESSLKLRQASVGPTITLSLQLLYSGIQEAIRSKSLLTSDFEARLQSSAAAASNLETQNLRLEQCAAELKGHLQKQSSSSGALFAENANLKQQLRELQLRSERQANQFAADSLLEKQTHQQVLAAHELQASNALSGLQDKLVQVHAELEKLRTKNREENARARADARFAYEQRMQDVTNDSLADSSSLASFIESSVTEALSLEQSIGHLQSRMHFK